MRLEFLFRPDAAGDAARKVAHADEPLLTQIGLDGRLGAVGVADLDLAVLNRFEKALDLEVANDALAGFEPVESCIGAGHAIERAVGVKDAEDADLALVPLPDGVVVGIVAGRDFNAARAQGRVGPFVQDERDGAIEEREQDLAPRPGHVAEF